MKVSDFLVNLTDLTATIYANVLAIPLNYFYDGGVGGGRGRGDRTRFIFYTQKNS